MLDEVTTAITTGIYDDFDVSNLNGSMMCLLNSVDHSVKQDINPYINAHTTGPELLMRIVGTAQQLTVERMAKVNQLVQEMKLNDVAGENVKEYSKKMIVYYKDI
jgi:hypothetical protein